MEQFQYTDTNGESHQFWLDCGVSQLLGRQCWDFDVWPTPEPTLGSAPYQARFESLDEATVQSTSVSNNDNDWAKRIQLSEAVFNEAKRIIGRRIVSSRDFVPGEGEWRTTLATRMWQRFKRNGLARYNASEGRFEFLG